MVSMLLFRADDGGIGDEPWLVSADGTPIIPIDLDPGPGDSFVLNALSFGGPGRSPPF